MQGHKILKAWSVVAHNNRMKISISELIVQCPNFAKGGGGGGGGGANLGYRKKKGEAGSM